MQSPNRPRQIWLILLTALISMVFWRAPVLAQDPTEEQLELGAQLFAVPRLQRRGARWRGTVQGLALDSS
jgi:hypothetical protein